jgi:hypothetical protein
MNCLNQSLRRGLASSLACAFLILSSAAALAVQEENFALLQIGTRTYTNATITTRSKTYIMILHSGGIASLKVADLSPETQKMLGYQLEKPKTPGNAVSSWAKSTLAKAESPQVQALEAQFSKYQIPLSRFTAMDRGYLMKFLVGFLGGLLLFHLFFSACCKLICLKAGGQPGGLVWVPVLQLIPLLRAAGMSPLWFLAYFVPGLNLLAHILWSVNISKVRAKGILTVICLILPGLNVLAFLYLAFSSDSSAERETRPQKQKITIMSLETA